MIESDGMSVMQFKSIFASLLSVTSEQNKNINLAAKELEAADAYAERDHETR